MTEKKYLSTESLKVAILLCSYNGQKYLTEQLESFWQQTHTNWELWVSDDGSTDETIEILKKYKQKCPRLRQIFKGPQKSFVNNFFFLLRHNEIQAPFYAFSDQDDVWYSNKLECALKHLAQISSDIPALYCGRTLIVDSNNCPLNYSSIFHKKPSFQNALVQSLAGGNTMVINKAARDLFIKTAVCEEIISHDWWLYILITGHGGHVIYDINPYTRYRQHSNNIVGSSRGIKPKLLRIKKLIKGLYKNWNDKNIKALIPLQQNLTEKNRQTLQLFSEARTKSLIQRLLGIYKSGVYHQTFSGNLGIIISIFFKKI